jgi:NADP-dependent 3-hydroxy acid dehydrogenase YdfG
MANDFGKQVVVVTGASAGIGEALARELASRGARLVLAARRKDELERVATSLGDALPVVTDVTRRADVEKLRDAAIAHYGHIDAWVNNAGRAVTRPIEGLTDEDVDVMMRDNVKSALYGMQAVLPHFKQRGTGTIANVTSMLGRFPVATFRSAYSAAKAALDSLTGTVRFELAESHPGIRVVLLIPGVVATDFGKNALGGGPDSRALPNAQAVDEVARVFADGLRDGRAEVYSRPELAQQVMGYRSRLNG